MKSSMEICTMSDYLRVSHAVPSLRGQHIVIIGGSSGVEYAAADCALAEGAQVTIASNHGARVEEALARLGRSALGGIVDVREEASVTDFFSGLATFDHLIYMVADSGPRLLSASLTHRGSTAATDALSVTDWGALTVIKYAQSRLCSRGSITLTDSILLHRSRTEAVPPCVFDHMTRSLAVDLAPLRVNAVRFGCTAAEREVRSELVHHTHDRLIPRIAEPVEIAQAYLYLLRGSYTTGQVLVVDGGMTLL
jgi:NAD(P)-dependent dehydrogenase (short-subunit alcohol dehydrogenase family)